MKEKVFFMGGVVIAVKKGDITEENADAIVNPADAGMSMKKGIGYAIKRKGGQSIEKEAMKKAPARAGEAKHTKAGRLPSKYILHAAVLEAACRADAKTVREATKNAMLAAAELKTRSIALPALGCGTGGLNAGSAARVMVEEVLRVISSKSEPRDIRFVLSGEKDFEGFSLAAEKYLASLAVKTYRNPVPTVDVIIEKNGGVVLIKRKNYPYGWALPGGFVDYGESLEDAALREAKEETGLKIKGLKQFHTYSQPGRDPRYHTVSTVFTGRGAGRLKAADDAEEAKVFVEGSLPKVIAFDHRDVLNDYFGPPKKQGY